MCDFYVLPSIKINLYTHLIYFNWFKFEYTLSYDKIYFQFISFKLKRKKQFEYNNKLVSWIDLPVEEKRQHYFYYFDKNGKDLFPNSSVHI